MADDSKKRAGVSSTKEGGYASQKRYRQNHPDRVREQKRKQNERLRGSIYEPKLRIPMENKHILEKLLADTELSITQLCIGAVEEKYGVTIQKQVDKPDT